MKKLLLAVVLLFFFTSNASYSQILEINKNGTAESTYTPQELIEKVLTTCSYSEVSNFSSAVFGAPTDNTTKSYGYFKKPIGSDFPFEEGIILTTGSAFGGGNNATGSIVDNWKGLSGDAGLGSDFLTITNTAACGTTQLLDAQITATSYKWYKNTILIPGEAGKTYVANLGNGTYKVKAQSGANCTSVDEVVLEFVATSIIKPVDWEFCDIDTDGFNAFDIKTKMDTEILNGQDPPLYTVSYFSIHNIWL